MGLKRTLSFFLFAAGLSAQTSSGRAYSTGDAWWNAGWGGILPWDENYDNPDGQVSIKNRGGAIRTKDHAFFDPARHQWAGVRNLSSTGQRDGRVGRNHPPAVDRFQWQRPRICGL